MKLKFFGFQGLGDTCSVPIAGTPNDVTSAYEPITEVRGVCVVCEASFTRGLSQFEDIREHMSTFVAVLEHVRLPSRILSRHDTSFPHKREFRTRLTITVRSPRERKRDFSSIRRGRRLPW